MKLDRSAIVAFALLSAAMTGGTTGCAARSSQPAAPVSTTQVTSAEIGEANAPTPRTGKAHHASSPERPVRSDSQRRGDVFGWK